MSNSDSAIDAQKRTRARAKLLQWYDRHARQLPWRPSPGAYQTWISEVMLQQTQVATVCEYYDRFLTAFPAVADLAAADLQDVLRLWEGLGYYRRARQMHLAARAIVERHGGRFPTQFDQLMELPGIGRYTAGAILSIACDQRFPVLEANTLRVTSRLMGLEADPRRAAVERQLWEFAQRMLPRKRVGDWNQAMMELGSLVCAPKRPKCADCPLRSICQAGLSGRQELIPPPRIKPSYRRVHEAAVVVLHRHKVLLRECQAGERWAGLWDFPRVAVPAPAGRKRDAQLVERIRQLTGLEICLGESLMAIRHTVTRYRITLDCRWATLATGRLPPSVRSDRTLQWLAPHAIADVPLSVTGRKISRRLQASS